MANPKQMFLIRNGQGHMRTVIAQSVRGAVQSYLDSYPSLKGEVLEVKPRGSGDWEAFKLS